MTIDDVQTLALSLPEVTEEPHFQMSSFRIRDKIFATVPPDRQHLHVFVAEQERETMVTLYPETYEKLWWGKKVVGLRVRLATVQQSDLQALLQSAWRLKAPRKLVELLQQGQGATP